MKKIKLCLVDENCESGRTPIWEDGSNLSWFQIESLVESNRLLYLDLVRWVDEFNILSYRASQKVVVNFEIYGLELLLRLRDELEGKYAVDYYSRYLGCFLEHDPEDN